MPTARVPTGILPGDIPIMLRLSFTDQSVHATHVRDHLLGGEGLGVPALQVGRRLRGPLRVDDREHLVAARVTFDATESEAKIHFYSLTILSLSR